MFRFGCDRIVIIVNLRIRVHGSNNLFIIFQQIAHGQTLEDRS